MADHVLAAVGQLGIFGDGSCIAACSQVPARLVLQPSAQLRLSTNAAELLKFERTVYIFTQLQQSQNNKSYENRTNRFFRIVIGAVLRWLFFLLQHRDHHQHHRAVNPAATS
jgi:hypothetical protein